MAPAPDPAPSALSRDSYPALLELPQGLDVNASLARFSRHGDDLMDRWDGVSFRRPFRIQGQVGALRLRPSPETGHRLEVETDSGQVSAALAPRLASMFVDDRLAMLELGRRDRVIAELDELHPGVFPVRALDPLAALLSMVSAQQVNLTVALSFRRALLLRLGRRISIGDDFVIAPDPERLASASAEDWASVRFSRAKARCLTALGIAVSSGSLAFEELELAPDGEVRERLLALPGLGPWTAAQYLTRVLGRPVVVADDLGVRKAVQFAYRLDGMPTSLEVLRITADYGPAAFSAQQLLLYHLSQATTSKPPVLGRT